MPELYEVSIALSYGGHLSTYMELGEAERLQADVRDEEYGARRYACYGHDWMRYRGDVVTDGFLVVRPHEVLGMTVEKMVFHTNETND
jgi:hypothetical protein